MSINYQEEVKKLHEYEENSGNWFKPEAGKYDIILLAEPDIIEKEFNEEKKQQARLQIEVDKKQYTWDIGIGKTLNSIYAQLMLIGADKGKLIEEKITLIVKRAKDKNEYTVLEAIDLMKPKEESV